MRGNFWFGRDLWPGFIENVRSRYWLGGAGETDMLHALEQASQGVDQASIMAIVLYKVVTASRNKQLLRKLTRGSLSVVSKNRQPSVSDIDEGPTQLLISLKISV